MKIGFCKNQTVEFIGPTCIILVLIKETAVCKMIVRL